ncbi:alpha/beta hydrolase [uncultured Aeromicrobium sp.]|uniref:alpha/beta hydrolase n=1 Tax=uncultured Aeromicrobium sp. TaxID=337820 RepID=UPI0025F7CA94|nr:alpha/beta hydrolase [uncultured Aeromicrobium sp.]
MSGLRVAGRWALRLLIVVLALVVGIVIWAQFSPRPGVIAIDLLFRLSSVGEVDDDDAPETDEEVDGRTDLAYGDGDDETLDVWFPRDRGSGPLPVIVWVHGGGWIGGDKEGIAPYLQLLAAKGYAAVGIDYSLGPDTHYPVPLEQTDKAIVWLEENAAALGLDTDRLVLAGDSAGAQIAAQYLAMLADADYAREVGVEPTVAADRVVGALLHSGPYDPGSALQASGLMGWFVRTVGWAYLGTKDFDDPRVEQASVTDHLTEGFPPTLVTGGEEDPLTAQGKEFAKKLTELGVEVETYWAEGLNHEFQFDVSDPQAQQVLTESDDFLAEVTGR